MAIVKSTGRVTSTYPDLKRNHQVNKRAKFVMSISEPHNNKWSGYVNTLIPVRIAHDMICDIKLECPGASRDMIRVVLRQLRDEGLIVSRGWGRGAKWVKSD